jgi:hypothetical protein
MADGAHADVELPGDLSVGAALNDHDDQFLLPGLSFPSSGRTCGTLGIYPGEQHRKLGGGGQRHVIAALFGGLGAVRSQRLPCRAQWLPAALLRRGQIGYPEFLQARGMRGPHRDSIGPSLGRHAQTPAVVKTADQAQPVAGPREDLECFPQMLSGLGHAASQTDSQMAMSWMQNAARLTMPTIPGTALASSSSHTRTPSGTSVTRPNIVGQSFSQRHCISR